MADKITSSLAEAKILVMEGQAGYSPQITIEGIQGGHRVTITSETGSQYFDVMDGEALDSDAIAEAVADYLDTHPISAPVASVNGKTGEVDLDADDVGASTSQVSISGNVITIEDTARGTIVAYAITPASIGAGTYSKPSGGIPKTDLASDVQTSLGKADTAYQKPSGGIPASDLAAGVIPTVPTKVSDLTNDSGFQTAPFEIPINTDEQGNYSTTASAEEIFDNADNCIINFMGTHIAPMTVTKHEQEVNIGFTYGLIQYGTLTSQTIFVQANKSNNNVNISVDDEFANLLPDVTASDDGKFLRVVNGAWAAQAVPAAESNSFGGGS